MFAFLQIFLLTALFLLPAMSLCMILHSVTSRWRCRGQEPGAMCGSVPQGSTGWPLIGETFAFIKPHPYMSIGEFLEQHVSRFGRVFTSNLFGKVTIVSTDTQFTKFIVQDESKAFIPGWPRSMFTLIRFFTLVGDEHKYMRSVIVHFLAGAKLQTFYLPIAGRVAAAVLSSWEGGGAVLSAKAEAKKFTFGVSAKAILGLEPNSAETGMLESEFEVLSAGLMSLPLNFPGTAYWKALKARSAILNTISQKREERKMMIKDGIGGHEIEEDLLTYAMKNTNYTEEQTGELLMGFFLGGDDTSAKVIALAFYFLSRCPEALQQMREEHRAVAETRMKVDKEKPAELDWEGYKKLDFTTCVLYESLRLGQVIKFVQRQAVKDVEYQGHFIPKGYNVMAVYSAVHMDPSLFEDPQTFNPWRWKLHPSGVKKTNLMSFSGGDRICPGAEVARLQFAAFFHHVLLNYKWELVDPSRPLTYSVVDLAGGHQLKVYRLEEEES